MILTQLFAVILFTTLLSESTLQVSAAGYIVPDNNDINDILLVGTKRFKFSTYPTPISWTDAYNFCKLYGMTLATIDTDNENNNLKEYINIKPGVYYVGSLRTFTADFHWINGVVVNYNYMGFGEPNNMNNNENCLAMVNSGLADWPCGINAGIRDFICQK